MAFAGEVGLQLLLSPLNSNIVVRTACCTVGTVLPVYATCKAIEKKDPVEQQRWLLYWAAYGTFSLAEVFADKILFWFPLYYPVKFAFLVWLQLPSVNGARQLYMNQLRPFLLRHQARFDRIMEFLYYEAVMSSNFFDVKTRDVEDFINPLLLKEDKFVIAHQAEFKFAKALLVRILEAVNHLAQDLVHPLHRQPNGDSQDAARHVQDSQSDEED